MRYTVELTEAARRALVELPKDIQRRIASAIEILAEDPFRPRTRKLAGHPDLYRYRVGDYRIVFTSDRGALRIIVIRVGHRSSVYRGL
jgi:mRNA interferase RelE/StbE